MNAPRYARWVWLLLVSLVAGCGGQGRPARPPPDYLLTEPEGGSSAVDSVAIVLDHVSERMGWIQSELRVFDEAGMAVPWKGQAVAYRHSLYRLALEGLERPGAYTLVLPKAPSGLIADWGHFHEVCDHWVADFVLHEHRPVLAQLIDSNDTLKGEHYVTLRFSEPVESPVEFARFFVGDTEMDCELGGCGSGTGNRCKFLCNSTKAPDRFRMDSLPVATATGQPVQFPPLGDHPLDLTVVREEPIEEDGKQGVWTLSIWFPRPFGASPAVFCEDFAQ